MDFCIRGVADPYTAPDVVVRLGKFILNKRSYLFAFKEIIVTADIADNLGREQLIVLILKEAVLAKTIAKNEARYMDEFKELLKNFFKSDLKDSGNTRGKLFEYLIYNIGPIILDADVGNISIKRNCFIRNNIGCCVGGKNNFDVVFYKNHKKIEDLEIELLECKIKIENVLCIKKNVLSTRVKKKLRYMETVAEYLSGCKICFVGLITLSPALKSYSCFLREQGYQNITVLGYDDVQKALYTKT